jgi:hypothetical protein
MIPKRRDNKEEDGHQARAVKGKGMLRKPSDSIIVSFLHFLSCSLSLSLSFFLIFVVLAEELSKTT